MEISIEAVLTGKGPGEVTDIMIDAMNEIKVSNPDLDLYKLLICAVYTVYLKGFEDGKAKEEKPCQNSES